MTKRVTTLPWIVVPAYNEERYLAQVLQKLSPYEGRVVVIDDGSQDQTATIARSFPVYTLRHRLNLGKGAALRTACEFVFNHQQAASVILIDGDDQHDPAELPLFEQALAAGNQVVFGIRSEPQDMPWLRLKMNRLGSFLTYLLFGTYILDIPSGYKAFTCQAYQKIAWNSTDYAVELEIAARTAHAKMPFHYVNIKTIYHDTTKGMTMLDVLSVVKHLVTLKATL